MTLPGTRAARAAAALLLAAAAAVVAAPLATVTATYASYGVGLLPPARPYLPLAAPAALLAASAALELAGRRRPAAYLSTFAASYYLTLALAESLRANPGRALVVPLAPNVFLVGPGRAEVPLPAAALAAASAAASALLLLAPPLPGGLATLLPEAERLARLRYGTSFEELRRRSPGLAEAVVTYARFAAGWVPPGGPASARRDEATIRRVADAEARRRFGVPLEELEARRPRLAKALLDAARYLPEPEEGGRG